MSRMIFVTGFARGGTTWLRNCIGTHPEIGRIGKELVLFRDHAGDRAAMEQILDERIVEQGLTSRLFVEKSPANAPFIDQAARLLPEAKFIFIIRDPRDVFISHKRGTREWMGGANSTVGGCMKKIRHYYAGYERAHGLHNLLLVRYEDLHQNFHATMQRVFEFIDVDVTPEILNDCHQENNFWTVASRHIERRDEAERKGVVGDWVNFLETDEALWFQREPFWTSFMHQFGYSWDGVTYRRILKAISDAGARTLDEQALLDQRLDACGLNLLLVHDIDNLITDYSQTSILEIARIEAELGMAGLYFFLPLDDFRYRSLRPGKVISFIKKLKRVNARLTVGLHLNAAERFFPAGSGDLGDDHPDMPKAVAYLHQQIDEYERHGISFRTATAHGYGRRKDKPNNRDSAIFTQELSKRGIALWDTVLRPQLFEMAGRVVSFADVGGAISVRELSSAGSITDAETYHGLPRGSLIHMLIHPGNYDVRKPSTLGRRENFTGLSTTLIESRSTSS